MSAPKQHLRGLAAKLAERKAKRANRKPGEGALTGETYPVAMTYVRPTRADRQSDHKRKMAQRGVYHAEQPARVGIPASVNRRTGKPHEHKREIARRARQAAARPGSKYHLETIA